MDEIYKVIDYKLKINPTNLMELKKDIWNKQPVPARLIVEGQPHELAIALKYRGSHIRKFVKVSYELSFKTPMNYKGAKRVHLNAEYKDPSLIRNKLSFDLFSDIGVLSPNSQHIFMTTNGKAEGLYLEIESVDAYFLRKRKLPKGSIFYAVDGDANFSLMSDLDKETKKSLKLGYEREVGDRIEERYLEQFIYKINTLLNSEFEQEIEKYLNVKNYLRWLSGVIFTSNYDGFVHNYALYRNGETGLFEVIPWDYDATWGRDVNGKLMEADYVPIEGFNTLTARLLDVRRFRREYRSLLMQGLHQHFTIESVMPKAETLHRTIRPYVLKDPYKKQTIDQFDKELEIISEYISERREYLNSNLVKLD